MSGPVVRRIRPSEADELRRVRLAMLEDAPDAFHSRLEDEAAEPREFWADRARRAAAGDTVATFVAVEAGTHLGSATGLRLDPGEPALLVAMWVDPAARGRGLGRLLVEAVCAWAERCEASSVELGRAGAQHPCDPALPARRVLGRGRPHPAEAAPELNELRMARRLDRRPDGPVITGCAPPWPGMTRWPPSRRCPSATSVR
jgi:GNAT superfamily N-acetyltransferase